MQRRALIVARGGDISFKTYEGNDYIVFPVIALVEGVLFASNADHPEMVWASEFEKFPASWNGRPIVLDHPEISGEKTSANSPRVLEKYRLGYMFNTEAKNKKLRTEAWIDPARVSALGEEAERAMEIIQSNEGTLEVSVGVFVESEETGGEYKGKPYASTWRNIVPDHLALLPEGTKGACSVEMGCGAPRAAGGTMKKNPPTPPASVPESKRQAWLERAAAFRPSQDISDIDIRFGLEDALRAVEPGFLGVDAVFPESNQVVYAVMPEDSLQLFRRGYTLNDGAELSLADDREEVKVVTTYEALVAAANNAPPTATCGCGGTKATPEPAKEDSVSQTKKERVAALIARADNSFTPAHAATLESQSDELLTILEAGPVQAPVPAPAPAPVPAPAPAVEAPALTLEQVFQAFPEVKEKVEAFDAQQKKEHDALVEDVAAAAVASGAYTKEELAALSTGELKKLKALTTGSKPKGSESRPTGSTVVDFSAAAGTPRGGQQEDPNAIPAPPSMVERIKAARAAK